MAAGLLALLPSAATAYKAEIRRTAHGIPHIQANSYGNIGFGYGYAFAQDNICPIAEDYVTVDAERSRFFGPGGTYLQRGNGFSARRAAGSGPLMIAGSVGERRNRSTPILSARRRFSRYGPVSATLSASFF